MDRILAAVTEMAGKVFGGKEDMPKASGPDEVGPTVERPGNNPLVSLPMTPDQMTEWWSRIKDSDDRVRKYGEAWDILLDEYMPVVKKSGEVEAVRTNVHFRNVHSKIGQLFYRSPDPVLTAKDVAPLTKLPYATQTDPGGQLTIEEITTLKQEILKAKLGRDGIKVERLFDELLFDNLAWTGLGCSKLGYECTMRELPPPTPQPGAVLGLQGQPAAEKVPVYENYYWRRFSAKKLITNSDLRSTRFDEDATIMGHHFFWTPEKVSKRFKIPLDQLTGKSSEQQYVHDYTEDPSTKNNGLIHGVELFVKASAFTDEVHPQAINQLVLIEGVTDKPVIWRPSPDQEFDPATGKLTVDSMIGFPIRVLTIRDLADSFAPPSDAAFENSLAKQKNLSRRQGIRYRDAAIGKILYDGAAFDDQDVEKIKNGEVGDWIEVEEGKLALGVDKIMGNTLQVHASPDDYRLEASIDQDIRETLGLGAGSGTSLSPTIHTATENKFVQDNANTRNSKEQSRVVDHYLDGVRMIDSLIMRYSTAQDYQSIVGQDGARKLLMWNNQLVQGRYEYDIAPDSQLHADSAHDFQLSMQAYNLFAKDPLVNRQYIIRRMARQRGWDPIKVCPPPPPPAPPQPPKPNVSVAIKAEDILIASATLALNPNDIGAQTIMALVEQAKVPPPPPPGEPPHGGAAPTAEAISDHQLSNSGGMENSPGAGNFRAERV